MSRKKSATRAVRAECPLCGHSGRDEVAHERHDLSSVGRKRDNFPLAVVVTLACGACRSPFRHPIRGHRRVVGYHGCERDFADRMTSGHANPEDWEHSSNPWEWLGDGIYFWEEAPRRAWEWAANCCRRRGGEPAVVGAVLTLGRCVDLGDTGFTMPLARAYETLQDRYVRSDPPKELPVNRPFFDASGNPLDSEDKFRELDGLVVEELVEVLAAEGVEVQTVRAPFGEGKPAYRGGLILAQSHVQIAVRDRACIAPLVWRAPAGDFTA